MPIALQFSAQNDLGSETIRWFDHGQFSHVDAILEDGTLLGARSDVLMGVPSGVQIRPANYANFSVIKPVIVSTNTDQASKFIAFLTSQIGKPYDETAILGFIAGREWRRPDSWFCSELIAAALEDCKFFEYELAAVANKIAPDDLTLVLSGKIKI